MERMRRQFTPQQKVAIVREHIVDKMSTREEAMFAAREQKLRQAGQRRQAKRLSQFNYSLTTHVAFSTGG